MYVCPICFYEWSDEKKEEKTKVVRDAVGNILTDGDSATIAKDLKLGKETIKQGLKVKDVRILEVAVNGHDLDGKVEGLGALYLKSSVIKKA